MSLLCSEKILNITDNACPAEALEEAPNAPRLFTRGRGASIFLWWLFPAVRVSEEEERCLHRLFDGQEVNWSFPVKRTFCRCDSYFPPAAPTPLCYILYSRLTIRKLRHYFHGLDGHNSPNQLVFPHRDGSC